MTDDPTIGRRPGTTARPAERRPGRRGAAAAPATSAAACRSSGRGRSRGCATARPRSSRPTSSSRSTSRSLRVLAEIGMDFLDAEAREVLRGRRRATSSPGTQRVRFDPAMVTELIKTAPSSFTLHARNPAHDLEHRRRLDRVRDGRQPAERRRPRPRPAGRQPRRLPEPAPARPDRSTRSTSSPATRSSRSTSTTSVRHLHAIHDALTLMDKAIHCLQPRPPAQHRRPRDGPHRPRRRRRDARPRAVGLHGHQLELAAAPRRADAPGDHRVRRRATRSSCITPFTLAGAMAPVTLAGALAEQNAEALAGMVLTQVVRPGRAGHLRRVHLERRHAVGRAGVRDAGVHADRDDRRPAGAALRRARIARRTCRAANALDAQAAYESVFSLWGAIMGGVNLLMHGAGWMEGGLHAELREDDPRRRAARDGRGVPRPGRRRRGRRSAFEAMQEVGPGGHFFGAAAHPVALPDRVPQADAQRLAQLRDVGGGRLAGGCRPRPTGSGRSCSPPTSRRRWTRPSREELDAFVARRVAEGGVPTDY